ncbi:class I SAM-dependent methyltransferase [Candidatus Liberibacter africanus]|uniref:Type 11 methyltransferase n=1 Tax=Candidatus Liberibacter africanus PTSAPSY TaxID=1277257 RepID=A0A0G3I4W8_LIBAF|nr:methyltransferase domain-containing protein [Candidatus Liberibacter africanus]AKK20325.1 type 11 methyltransferase [Candidatus Liberibacter africanus PTSAPSY]QTP64077.1 class I SAM-dependent methyltransferase [Candidatus Liberibacter africanus]
MRIDLIGVQQFYNSSLGKCTTDSISKVLSKTWNDVTGCRLLGLGYAIPFLSCFNGKAECKLAFIPAEQGITKYTYQNFSSTVLVYEERLPLLDSSVDCVLIVHYLEFVEDPLVMLCEVWRVLSSGGRMIIIIPNKRGFWAHMDHTPFGLGKSYSWYQLVSLLKEANFTVSQTSGSLFPPPTNKNFVLKLWSFFEKIGSNFGPGFAGVYVIEARKILYQGIPVIESKTKHMPVPILVPHTASTLDNQFTATSPDKK